MAGSIDPAVQAVIDASMNTMLNRVQEMINNQGRRQGPPGPPGPPGPAGLDAQSGSGNSNKPRFVAKELGFFNPFYQGKSAAVGPPLENSGEGTIFRDVYVFISRAKDFAATHGAELVRHNLYRCLQDHALTWHTSLLSPGEKRLLTLGDNLDEWEVALVTEFRESPAKVIEAFTTEHYTIQDTTRNKLPRDYAQSVIRLGKSAELPLYNQLLQIWNGLDVDFQLHVAKPTRDTKMGEFLRELDDKKDSWWKLAAVRAESSSSRREQKDRDGGKQNARQPQRGMLGASNSGANRGRGYGYGYQPGNYQRPFQPSQPGLQQPFMPAGFQNFLNQYQNRAYQNPQQQQQPPNQYSSGQPQLPALPAPPPMRQIAGVPAQGVPNASGSNQRQPFRQFDSNRQRPAKAFHGSEEQENLSTDYPEAYLNDLWDAYEAGKEASAYYGDGGYLDDGPRVDEPGNQDDHDQEADVHFISQPSAEGFRSLGPPNDTIPKADITEGDILPAEAPSLVEVEERLFTCRRCGQQFYSNNKLH